MELPVVNHPDYVAKINDDNKFPIQKFGALAEHLIKEKVVKKFYIPKECSISTLKTSHSLEYINHIKIVCIINGVLLSKFLRLIKPSLTPLTKDLTFS